MSSVAAAAPPTTPAPPPPAAAGVGLSLTSTTAPSKTFPDRAALAAHYKSDWHRYNLKRREAGLPLLKEEDFEARLEAAKALRAEREGRERGGGTDHLKDAGKKKKKKNGKQKKGKKGKDAKWRGGERSGDGTEEEEDGVVVVAGKSQAGAYDRIKRRSRDSAGAAEEDATAERSDDVADPTEEESRSGTDDDEEKDRPSSSPAEEPTPEIDPRQDLFSSHVSPSVRSNLRRMHAKYGFFVPDVEYLADLGGFVGYCHEKIKLGHTCLYCQRTFKTWTGCAKHMVDASHAKVRYERGVDMEEFDVFYDFSEADAEFLGAAAPARGPIKGGGDDGMSVEHEEGDEDIDGDEEWEDISDEDEEMEGGGVDDDEEEEEGVYAAYRDEIARHGFDVTALGELVFPDGRIVGHRGLRRYYRQRFAPEPEHRAAVVAARRAAGQRVLGGRVHETYQEEEEGGMPGSGSNALALARGRSSSGLPPPERRAGRAGNGILVSAGGNRGGYTQLSLYRYRAARKKANVDEARGRRLRYRTLYNVNRMDKKANRLMNGVSVAHAPR